MRVILPIFCVFHCPLSAILCNFNVKNVHFSSADDVTEKVIQHLVDVNLNLINLVYVFFR